MTASTSFYGTHHHAFGDSESLCGTLCVALTTDFVKMTEHYELAHKSGKTLLI